ncbi:MAG: biotin/lipoyl-containing protein, partial [Acidobacteriota bacterium]|nr:biotin/lipoyl-containing protein [Acidobacteriota bacterium]
MSTPVVMPQMGESIAEGTIVRWIKKVGDSVDRDEPLFEISTDKVDAEIPSPAAGVLMDIAVKEGETVPVNSVVATIGAAGEKVAAPEPAGKAGAAGKAGEERASAAPLTPPVQPAPPVEPAPSGSDDRQKSSPLVRRIAKEHNVDLGRIAGTGLGGRVTKQDILGFIESFDSRSVGATGGTLPQDGSRSARPEAELPSVPMTRGAGDQVVPMSVMR